MNSNIVACGKAWIRALYPFHYLLVFTTILALSLTAGCGGGESAATQPPITETDIGLSPTPSPTTFQPSEIPTPSPEPAYEPPYEPPSVDEVLAGLDGLPIDQFFLESYRYLRLRDPDILFADGYGDVFGVVLEDQFTDLSLAYRADTQLLEREILDQLYSYDREQLSSDQQISYDALAWYLETHDQGQAYADYRFLVNPAWGLQTWPIDFLLELPVESKKDAELYVARLDSLNLWADQVIERLEANEEAGELPPKYVIDDTIDQLEALLVVPGAERQEVYTDFRSKLNQIDELSDEEGDSLLAAALAAVEESFIPAYQALIDELEDLSKTAIEDPNQWQLPGGEDYFSYLLQFHTGTSLTAD